MAHGFALKGLGGFCGYVYVEYLRLDVSRRRENPVD